MAHSITVSIPLADTWPSAAELALRHELETAFDQALGGDGFVEGGGSGMGVMDIFIAGVLEVERVVDRINVILEERGLLGNARLHVADDTDDVDDVEQAN